MGVPAVRRFIALALLLCLVLPAFSDSLSWDTEIDGVSQGVDSFGWDLMPVGVSFSYDTDFRVLPFKRKSSADFDISVAFSDTSISDNYEWDTGTPRWYVREAEAEDMEFLSGDYFYPRADLEVSVGQGFWSNPNYPKEALFKISLGYYARYQMATEELHLSWNKSSYTPLFVDWSGNYVYPFGDYLDSFPWLSGDRRIFTDSVYLKFQLQMDRDTPKDVEAEHGFYAYLTFDYGPKWLFNDITNGTQSDYFRIRFYAEEKMELYTILQDNGWNWTNMYLGHSDTLNYTWGEVSPSYKLNTDRLRGYLTDRIWLHFSGPQFMTPDFYPYIELNLENKLSFGHVQNEKSQSTKAVELQSSVYAVFQLQLFGFIKLEYQLGYDFIRGIWPEKPEFWQYAEIDFYMSL